MFVKDEQTHLRAITVEPEVDRKLLIGCPVIAVVALDDYDENNAEDAAAAEEEEEEEEGE